MMNPDLTTPEDQLRWVQEQLFPGWKEYGFEALCEAAVWRKHPAVKEAIRKGEALVSIGEDGVPNLARGLAIAILEPIPTEEAQRTVGIYKWELKQIRDYQRRARRSEVFEA
jgi:hypothetical protein